jgi:hypothetical protein
MERKDVERGSGWEGADEITCIASARFQHVFDILVQLQLY